MPWTYILRCADGSYYVGSTRSLDHRMEQHASCHGSRYTARRLPVTLEWSAEFDDIAQAWGLERRIHGWSHAKREALVRGGFEEVRRLRREACRKSSDR
ncbi:MAG: GIY-YIG nuclease family protein [Acidimicrobiales bacterium]|nr:GIY-YIG nuclease family protein [Acidimicrobiales bacterium]